ncbi:MAG: T9SS type A sorting domain-containing protein, partial [Bacteroidetes bacterium]|nr:T9SS type A sorting domain-containing protein [Bacteroidota bacterium]MBS1777353.1 T9SS type A sorting domain-containing protein [Bacteroidota bacterium]
SEGRMVRTIPLDGNTPTTVQVADLPRGLYIAKFISKTGGVLVKKLIIE